MPPKRKTGTAGRGGGRTKRPSTRTTTTSKRAKTTTTRLAKTAKTAKNGTGRATRPSTRSGPGESPATQRAPGDVPRAPIKDSENGLGDQQRHDGQIEPREDFPGTRPCPVPGQHRFAAPNDTDPVPFNQSKRIHPQKPTRGKRRGPSGFMQNAFMLQRRERQAARRVRDINQYAATAGPTPIWPPAAPLRKNTYIGSPGPWNETPRVDGNVYRGKPMPPELAPGLDLYGTNEGGLTELFDEGDGVDEGDERNGGNDKRLDQEGTPGKDPGESEQSVDDNEIAGGAREEGMDGAENAVREALPQTPASVQTMLQRMRTRIREQEAYIQDLEDQLLALNEQLRRRVA